MIGTTADINETGSPTLVLKAIEVLASGRDCGMEFGNAVFANRGQGVRVPLLAPEKIEIIFPFRPSSFANRERPKLTRDSAPAIISGQLDAAV